MIKRKRHQFGYAILSIHGLYTGWWFTKQDAIEAHTKALRQDWEICKSKGDRVVKVEIIYNPRPNQ